MRAELGTAGSVEPSSFAVQDGIGLARAAATASHRPGNVFKALRLRDTRRHAPASTMLRTASKDSADGWESNTAAALDVPEYIGAKRR